MKFKQINWGLIAVWMINLVCWAVIVLLIVLMCAGCQRTDYHWQDDLLSISSTSWGTDTNIRKITIDPNGLVIIEQFDRKEDSIKAKAIIGGVPVTVETKGNECQ